MSSANDESPRVFLLRIRDALLRIGALLVLLGAHWVLSKAIEHVVPSNLNKAALFLEDIAFVFFAIIYVYLLWDMLKVFLPFLQAKPYPGNKVDETSS